MSLDTAPSDDLPLSSVSELLRVFETAGRPRRDFAVGLEHEKFVYPVGSARAVPYEGPAGISALLTSLSSHGYREFREGQGQPVIALTRGVLTLSLEPGGQFELSGSPQRTARQAHAENLQHLAEVKAAARALGLRLVALGYRPFDQRDQMPWMPKRRYQVMRQTLGERGALAWNMMLMTATGQVSLDWEDEADCARKVTAAARLTPLLVALYANSPLAEGAPTGFMSYRSRVWLEVDPARCGYLPAMLDGSFSFRAYVEWALDAPLLFLRRRGEYHSPRLTFRQLLAHGYEGEPPRASDWVDHLSTLFPEVRIKRVLEIRGADCVSAELTGALPALLRGLLYDPTALDEAEQLLPRLGWKEHLAFHDLARREGLAAKAPFGELARLGQELVLIARRGLSRLDPEDAALLDPLEAVARSGQSPGQAVLNALAAGLSPAELLARAEL